GSAQQIRTALPTIPDFTSLVWQMSQTDLEITHRIQDGNEPLMPAYRDKLSQQQILALAVYVRAFGIGTIETPQAAAKQPQPPVASEKPTTKPAPAPVAAAMPTDQLYRAYCLACHDPDGRGQIVRKAMPEVPDFTEAKWQGSRSDPELKKSILDGKGKFMLPMKDKLSSADADKMVAFVRAFHGSKQLVRVEPKPAGLPPPAQPAIIP